MKNTVNMSEMSSFEYRERIASGNPIMMMPVGAIEQHGPHMSMNVDVLLPTAVCQHVAEHNGAIVAPPITYGYKSQQRSGGGYHLTGTTSLDGETLTHMVKDIIKEFARHGIRRFCLCNGHFENNMFLVEGTDLALRELRWDGIDDVKLVFLSYWDFVDEATIARIYPEGFPGWDIEHGGVLESSLMLHLFPEHIHMDRVMDLPPADLPNYDVFPICPERTPASGCLSSAAKATAEKGQLLLNACVEGIADALRREFPDA